MSHPSDIADLIRRCFAAYESKDRAALEALVADDFHFSSPRDNRIDRQTYFERCWPFSEKVRAFRIEKLFVMFLQFGVFFQGFRQARRCSSRPLLES